MELINNKVAIEGLRLEPDIVYSHYINNKGQVPSDVGESAQEKQFRQAVVERVKVMERQRRQGKINELENKHQILRDSYLVAYKGDSIISKYENELISKKEKDIRKGKTIQEVINPEKSELGRTTFFGDKQTAMPPDSTERKATTIKIGKATPGKNL
jgi:hypothetical protein